MAKHKNHKMHKNSLAGFRNARIQKMRWTRAHEIIQLMADTVSRTDKQICAALGKNDMNDVRPRITDLVQLGTLVAICTVMNDDSPVPQRVTQLVQPKQQDIFTQQGATT